MTLAYEVSSANKEQGQPSWLSLFNLNPPEWRAAVLAEEDRKLTTQGWLYLGVIVVIALLALAWPPPD